jgi:hemerythrin superfamily protein
MNAIQLLKQDHRTVEKLFAEFERLEEKDASPKQLRRVVDQIIRELSIHAVIEETIFYPVVRITAETVDAEEAEDLVLESLEEHHIVKWTLSELEKMSPEDERFCAKVDVLMESVRHHVKEEERELFPQVRKLLAREELEAMGDMMERAKKMAPTRPHPRAPDQPPGNLVAGAVSSVLDRGMDAMKDLVSEAASKMRGNNKKRGGGREAVAH